MSLVFPPPKQPWTASSSPIPSLLGFGLRHIFLFENPNLMMEMGAASLMLMQGWRLLRFAHEVRM